jgi:hypothetical protein
MRSDKETGFLPNLSASGKYFRKNPVSGPYASVLIQINRVFIYSHPFRLSAVVKKYDRPYDKKCDRPLS